MTGRSVPRRYSKNQERIKTASRIEKSAVYFRSLQEFSATKPFMDATISVKVLGEGLKSSGSGNGKERTSGPDGDIDEGPKIKLDWNPRAKRKPGQVLKLHASYRELTSKEGAKYGWVDPAKDVSPTESSKAFQEAIEWKKKQPKAVIKLYKNTSHGTHEIEPAEKIYFKTAAEVLSKKDLENDSYSYGMKEISSLSNFISNTPLEVKKLGQTIGDILPGQRIDLGRALARGLVVDALGKLRCPPGTPNANQFTDIDMSNCMILSPKNVAQRLQNSIGRFSQWVNEGVAMGKEQDLIDSINPRFQKAKKNYTSLERNAEILALRESLIKGALLRTDIEGFLRAAGYGPGDDITEGNADLFAYLMGHDFSNEADPDALDRALTRIEGMFDDGIVWGPYLDKNGQPQLFETDTNGDFILDADGSPIPGTTGKTIDGWQKFKWDRDKNFKENMDAYNASIQNTMLSIIGDQNLNNSGITLRQAIDNFYDPSHPRHHLYKQAKEILDNFTNAHEASKRGTLKTFIQHSVENPEQYSIVSKFETFMPSHRGPTETMDDFWGAEGEMTCTPGEGPIPGLIVRTNTLGQIFKPYLDMEVLTEIIEPSAENPFGLTAKLDFDAQEGVEMSLAEKMSLWNQMISDISDADTFARMLKQKPVNDEEKQFIQLMTFYKKYAGYGANGSPIPRDKILDGAELENVLNDISRQMKISPEDASRLWFQFGKATGMYANDASAARAVLIGGNGSFLTALEAKAGHVAWHEIGHSLQYYAAGQQIQGFVDREGGFPLFQNGKLIRDLGPDTSLWTNQEWQMAIVSLTKGNEALMQDWPPEGVGKFEHSMLHLLAGAYYQDEVDNFWKNPSSTSPQLIVGLHEAHVELYALKKMGVIEGEDVDNALDYFENVVPNGSYRYSTPPRPSPNPPPTTPSPPQGPPGIPSGTPTTPSTPTTPGTPGTPGGGRTVTIGGDNTGIVNLGDNVTINTGDNIIIGDIIINGEKIDPDNITININITHIYPTGGGEPDEPKIDIEVVGTDGQPPVPADLWPRIASHISEDQATQWEHAPRAKTRVGRDKSRQKDWIDEVFGLTSEDTEVGGAGDETKDAFGQTKAYSEMTPEQLDARFEKIKFETDKLLERSKTEPLSENEQAKLWLGLKGQRQILHINRERSHMTDEKRAIAEERGYKTKPGKYMSKADGTYPPSRASQWKYKTALERHAAAGGSEISEIDEDELVHWHREIGTHAGSKFDGRPGFDASGSPYEKGKLREKANFITSADASTEADGMSVPSPATVAPSTGETPDVNVPDSGTPSAGSTSKKPRKPKVTAKTSPKEWGKKERDSILEWQAGSLGEFLNGDEPIEQRESFGILSGAFDEDGMTSLIRRSYEARKKYIEGSDERPSKPSPNETSLFVDEEITEVIAPMLRLLDETQTSEDIEIHYAIPSELASDVGAGEIMEVAGLTRGKIIDADSSVDMGSSELSTSTRVKIVVPAGSRGMPDKNSHNGDIDDMILPPGSFVIVDVDSDGTITAIPHYQKTAPEVLEKMLDDLLELPAPENDLERLERERIAIAINDARAAKPARGLVSNREGKDIPGAPDGSEVPDDFADSSRSQRGVSLSTVQQKRMKSRNIDASRSQKKSGSQPFAQDEQFVANVVNNPDTGMIGRLVTADEVKSRQQQVDEAVSNLATYSTELQKLINNPDADFIEMRDTIPRDVLEFVQKSTPEELMAAINDTVFKFHEGFDDRIHIPIQGSGFDDIMTHGRVRPISEINPNSNAAIMRSRRELNIGLSPNADGRDRTVNGYLRHASHSDAIQQHLDSLPPSAVKRNVNNFLDNEDFSPFGDIRKGDTSIDLVLLPEASLRSGYTRGDFMNSGNVPSPILSGSIKDASSAHMSLSTSGPSDRNAKLKQIFDAVDSHLTGKQNKLWSKSNSGGKVQGDKFDAIIPNGVDFDEVSEIKIPNKMLDTSSFSLSIEELGGVDMFKENGFSPKDRDMFLTKLNSGEIELKNAEWLAQHRAAKDWQNSFRERFGNNIALTFTNPDGVDVMNRESFSDYPGIQYGDNIEKVLKKRIAAEIAKNAQKLLKDTRSDKEIDKKLSRRVSPNTGMIDPSRSTRAIGSDLPFDLQTGKPRRMLDETDEQWAARQVPLLDLSKFNLPKPDKNTSGSRSRREVTRSLNRVGDRYKNLTTDEIKDLVDSSIPKSEEELLDVLKSNPYTEKYSKQLVKRILDAEPDYESNKIIQQRLFDEIDNNEGLAALTRLFGVPPMMVTNYEADTAGVGGISTRLGELLYELRDREKFGTLNTSQWLTTVGGEYKWTGFIHINPQEVEDRYGSLNKLLRHELAHAFNFMAAKQNDTAGKTVGKQFDRFQKLTDTEIISAKKISDYATTDTGEWFAEALSHLTSGQKDEIDKVDELSIQHVATNLGMDVEEFKKLMNIGDDSTEISSSRSKRSTRTVSTTKNTESEKPTLRAKMKGRITAIDKKYTDFINEKLEENIDPAYLEQYKKVVGNLSPRELLATTVFLGSAYSMTNLPGAAALRETLNGPVDYILETINELEEPLDFFLDLYDLKIQNGSVAGLTLNEGLLGVALFVESMKDSGRKIRRRVGGLDETRINRRGTPSMVASSSRSQRSMRPIGSDLPFDLQTGKPRQMLDETDEQWAARQDSAFDLSKFNLPESPRVQVGTRPGAVPESPRVQVGTRPGAVPESPKVQVGTRPGAVPESPRVQVGTRPGAVPESPRVQVGTRPGAVPESPRVQVGTRPGAVPESPVVEVGTRPGAVPKSSRVRDIVQGRSRYLEGEDNRLAKEKRDALKNRPEGVSNQDWKKYQEHVNSTENSFGFGGNDRLAYVTSYDDWAEKRDMLETDEEWNARSQRNQARKASISVPDAADAADTPDAVDTPDADTPKKPRKPRTPRTPAKPASTGRDVAVSGDNDGIINLGDNVTVNSSPRITFGKREKIGNNQKPQPDSPSSTPDSPPSTPKDGYASIYNIKTDDFISEAVDVVEYNAETRELRVIFAGQKDYYHFIDVDEKELNDFNGEFESIGSKIDRIKRSNNRSVRTPDGSVISWNGKEWSYDERSSSSGVPNKPKVPFETDIGDESGTLRDFSRKPATGAGPFADSGSEPEILYGPITKRVKGKEVSNARQEMYKASNAIRSPWGQPDEGTPEYANYFIKHFDTLNSNLEVLYEHILDIEDTRDENGKLTPSQQSKLKTIKKDVRDYESARGLALRKLKDKISSEDYDGLEKSVTTRATNSAADKSVTTRATNSAADKELNNPAPKTPKLVKYNDLKPLPASSSDESLPANPPDDWAPDLTDPVERDVSWQKRKLAHADKHQLVKVDGKLDARNLNNGSAGSGYESMHAQQAIVDMEDGESILIQNLPLGNDKHILHGIATKHNGKVIYSQLSEEDFKALDSKTISTDNLPSSITTYIKQIDSLKQQVSGTRLKNIDFTAVYILDSDATKEVKVNGKEYEIGGFVITSNPFAPESEGTLTLNGLDMPGHRALVRHEWGHRVSRMLKEDTAVSISSDEVLEPRRENIRIFSNTPAYSVHDLPISETEEWKNAIASDKQTSSQFELEKHGHTGKIIGGADGVTEYGGTSREEDLAEAIAIYMEARARPTGDWRIGTTADGRHISYEEMFPARFKLLNEIFDGKAEDAPDLSGRPIITLDSPPKPTATSRPTIPVSPTAGRPNIPSPGARPIIKLNNAPSLNSTSSTQDIVKALDNNMSAEDIAEATGMSLNYILNIMEKRNQRRGV